MCLEFGFITTETIKIKMDVTHIQSVVSEKTSMRIQDNNRHQQFPLPTISAFSLTVQKTFFVSVGQVILNPLLLFSPPRDVLPTLWEPSVCRSQGTIAAPSNATARWPWECRAVASFWQHDKSLNQKPGPTPPRTSKMRRGEQAGKGMPPHRVPEVMVWKCTMSLSVFCYVPVRWREKTGKRGSWWNDYIVAKRGRGARCWTAGRNHRCLTQFYNAQ